MIRSEDAAPVLRLHAGGRAPEQEAQPRLDEAIAEVAVWSVRFDGVLRDVATLQWLSALLDQRVTLAQAHRVHRLLAAGAPSAAQPEPAAPVPTVVQQLEAARARARQAWAQLQAARAALASLGATGAGEARGGAEVE